MIWSWLKNKARDAILAGVSEAVGELEKDGSGGNGDPLARLRAQLQPALPAPDSTTGVSPDGAASNGNGRTRKKAEQS